MNKKIIGICGDARSGKTTSARVLQMLSVNTSEHIIQTCLDSWWDFEWHFNDLSDFEIVSFADPLRSIAEILTGIPAEEWKDPVVKHTKLPPPYDNFTGREFLEYLGTEVLRDTLHKECHVAACDRIHGDTLIYDDLRMVNEAEYIKSRGGLIIQILGRGEQRNHESGKPLPKELIDITVDNSKTISYLINQLKEIYA